MPYPVKDKLLAYILLLPSFVGFAGIHRLYLGKWATAILWFITGGLFLVGTIYDVVTLGGQVDRVNVR